MKAVVQRVASASVQVDGKVAGAIDRGLVVLVGLQKGDGDADRAWMADKLANLRVFEDAEGRMNLSVLQVGGAVLLIPNFTVAGDARKGRRPSFDGAMPPGEAEPAFDALARDLAAITVPVQRSVFRAHMHVALVNDGPVTILLDSRG